jgi:hypothetical protein
VERKQDRLGVPTKSPVEDDAAGFRHRRAPTEPTR